MSDVEDVSKLKLLSALAINSLLGGTLFHPAYDGNTLLKSAIKANLFEFDNLHHAPACPANHFHQMRLPTGRCSCGATKSAAQSHTETSTS